MIIKNYTENYEIVDREDDIQQLKSIMEVARSSQVHIVYAKTGYGKSSFSIKLSREELFSDWDVIRIITMPKNVIPNVQEGDYLDFIFTKVNKYFSKKSKDLSFEYYISNGGNKMIEKIALNATVDTIANIKLSENPLIKLFALLFKRWLKIDTFDPYSIINDNSPITRSIKADYVRYIFNRSRILLTIENIQNIDNTSYKYLLDWVNDTKDKKHVFLFEYTVSDESDLEKMKDFLKSFSKTGVQVFESELERMPSKYIADIIESQLEEHSPDIHFVVKAQNHYKQYSNGNLWDLIDYARNYSTEEQQAESHAPTLHNLQNLSCEAQYIISILIYHSGIISKKNFEYIWLNYFSNSSPLILEKIYLELYTSCTIKFLCDEFSEHIAISHASIIDVWQTNGFDFIAIDRETSKRLVQFYLDNYSGNLHLAEKQFSWQMLIRIYATHEPKKIMELLDDFKSNLMKNISRENTWNYLELLIKHTKENILGFRNAYLKILQICRSASLFKEGYSCVKLMESCIDIWHDEELLLHKLLYLSILDEHYTVIELYKEAIKNKEKYSPIWIRLKLLVLNSYIALGNKSSCLKIDDELTQMHDFKSQPEYAIYLRLTNIYKKPSCAVHDAKKSIRLFHERGDKKQEGKSYITYSKLLSSLGNHKKAIAMIKRAEELLAEYNEGMSCIYNNLAGYLLMLGKHGQEVWDYLDIAEIYSVSTYDKLSVTLNKLAWCYENNSFIQLDFLENRALELIKMEPTRLIHCTTFYNLYIAMKKAGMKDKADKYYSYAMELKEHCSFIKARIDGLTRKNRYLKPRLRRPYHICYLSFWLYDL